MSQGDAVTNKLVANQTLAYFIGRTYFSASASHVREHMGVWGVARQKLLVRRLVVALLAWSVV